LWQKNKEIGQDLSSQQYNFCLSGVEHDEDVEKLMKIREELPNQHQEASFFCY
jgi:hypothetical protein